MPIAAALALFSGGPWSYAQEAFGPGESGGVTGLWNTTSCV